MIQIATDTDTQHVLPDLYLSTNSNCMFVNSTVEHMDIHIVAEHVLELGQLTTATAKIKCVYQ